MQSDKSSKKRGNQNIFFADYYPSRKWAKWEICYRELTKIFIGTWSCWEQLPNDIGK
jgi:hypothetical protein